MGADQNSDWRALAASALAWWSDAGVDCLVDDLPRDWLAAETPVPLAAAAVAATPAVTAAALAPAPAMPMALAEFLTWRLGADVPEAGWSGISLAASGPADAAVMVLVDCPDRDDGDAGALLSGLPGRLFDRMLAAIGLTRESVHLAAVCARRPATGRAARDTEARLADLARHHVALVAPKRLLLLGDAASRALLGTTVREAQGRLHPFNHKDGVLASPETQVVASYHPRFLIEKPAAKAEAWKDLQMLIGGMTE